jgi:DNA-binding transcriptional LysR family regulator
MELRQLHFFVLLSEELNFRRAAERVPIAQPAFSEQIRRLEGDLGTRLFDRTSHYVRLTEAGRLFLQEIRPALAQVEHAAGVAARAGQGVIGSLTVGLAAAAVTELTPRIVREFAARWPQVGLELRGYGFADSSAGIDDGAVDVAVLALPLPAEDELEIVMLRDEPRVAVLPADHPLAAAEALNLEEVAGEPLVIGPRSAGSRGRAASELTADTTEAWLALIAAGCGIGLATASMQCFNTRPGLAFVPMPDVAPVTLAVACRPPAAPTVRAFVEIARECACRGDRQPVSRETELALAGVAPGRQR